MKIGFTLSETSIRKSLRILQLYSSKISRSHTLHSKVHLGEILFFHLSDPHDEKGTQIVHLGRN